MLMIEEKGWLVTSAVDGGISFYDYKQRRTIQSFKKEGKSFSMVFAFDLKLLFLGSETENILTINLGEFFNKLENEEELGLGGDGGDGGEVSEKKGGKSGMGDGRVGSEDSEESSEEEGGRERADVR